MLAKPQGFPRKLGGCAGLDPRLAPRCRLVWAMGNGASDGGSGHRV